MKKIIIREKLSKKIIFYLLVSLITLPTLYFQWLYQRKYANHLTDIQALIKNNNINKASISISNHFKHYGNTKKALLLHLDYLIKKDQLKHNKQNWQQIIRTVSFLENHYYLVPKTAKLLKAKAFYHLGESYYEQGLSILEKLDFMKHKNKFDYSQVYMTYTMFKNKNRYDKAHLLIDHLMDKYPSELQFKIESANLFIQEGKNTKARELLKQIVFSHPYSGQLQNVAKILIELTLELKIYKEVDYLYNYIIEKSDFNLDFQKNYILFLKDQNQIKKATQYISSSYKNGRIDKTTRNKYRNILL